MIWFKLIQKFIAILNAEATPSQIAGGFTLGAMLGLVPKGNLIALSIFLVAVLIRVNFGMVGFATALFSMFAYLGDPYMERLGYFLLTGIPALTGAYIRFYNMPLVPFTNFNHTLVMGGLVTGLLMFIPLYFATRAFVVAYRERILENVRKWKVMQAFKASNFFQLYMKVKGE